MPKYQYNGEDERSFPTLGITVKKGETFDSSEEINAPGLSIVSSGKTAPAEPAKENKSQVKSSASSDMSAGA